MKIRNLTDKQYKYLQFLIDKTNYQKCKDLSKLTIIQASYLIKKLERKRELILIIANIYHKLSTAKFDIFFWESELKRLLEEFKKYE